MALVTRNVLESAPTHRGPALLIINIIMSLIVGLIVLLRLYTRLFVQRWFGSDDVLIIISLIASVSFTAVTLVGFRSAGWDRHFSDIPSSRIQETLIFGFIHKILFGVACTCIRASFLCFYQRLLRTTNYRWYKFSLYAIWAYVLGLELVSLVIEIFSCHPVRAYWAYPAMKSSCLDEGLTNTILGAFHCLCDFIITVWPIPIILKLQLPKRVRNYTVALLNVGFTVTSLAVCRTYFIWAANASDDVTWRSYPLLLASGFELNMGMICACALALRPLFTKFSDPARGAFDPRTVRVSTARFSTYRPPAQRPSESLEKFSDKSLDTPPGPFESTSQIRGGSTTPVTLDEEFGDMRDRASINGILVRTTFRVENS